MFFIKQREIKLITIAQRLEIIMSSLLVLTVPRTNLEKKQHFENIGARSHCFVTLIQCDVYCCCCLDFVAVVCAMSVHGTLARPKLHTER